jgi:integrase
MQIKLLTLDQTASILQINEHTLNLLAQSGQVPHIRTPGTNNIPVLHFDPDSLTAWLKHRPKAPMTEKDVNQLKRQFQVQFPDAIHNLKALDKHCTGTRTPKGYNLVKVPNKKLGFVYYVRYTEKGRLIPSRWCTHTNNPELAAQFAVNNRERLLAQYHAKADPRRKTTELYSVMRHYYELKSPYLATDTGRGRTITEATRRTYQHFMADQWVPYLKKQGVKTFDDIDTPFMARFQNYCLRKGKKPQTIAHYISTISLVFDHLLIEGGVTRNPCTNLTALKPGDGDRTARGCYEIDALHGVFNRRWTDKTSYLLCLLIYTTGMRNSEIERVQGTDIITIGDCRYIDIPKSKTKNGVRLVPLHEFVYHKIARFMRENGKTEDDYLFSAAGSELSGSVYQKANRALAAAAKYPADKLAKEHITFYSGRHYWKTLMSAEGIGDVEEYFMGHKVSGDVAKRYNHRDKQGQQKFLAKTKEIFAILDRHVLQGTS